MKRYCGSFATLAFAGCVGLVTIGGAFGQAGGNSEPANERRQTSSPAGPTVARPSDNRVPLPDPQRVPLPPVGGRTPIGGGGQPDAPAPRPRPRDPPRDSSRDQNPPPADEPRSATEHARDLEDDARRRHGLDSPNDNGGHDSRDDRDDRGRYRRPGYYDHWRDDRYRGYDDYRGYEPLPPQDAGYGRAGRPATDPAGGHARAGALLPPDDLMDDDHPPALRRALDASPQYREATAQLLRTWADYARAAEQVLQRLRSNPAYRRALTALAEAETKVAALRDRGGNVPAVNLVDAAQQALLARRAVRSQEERAIDADPIARRAKQQVDQVVARRNKIRDDIAAKLPPEPNAEAGR